MFSGGSALPAPTRCDTPIIMAARLRLGHISCRRSIRRPPPPEPARFRSSFSSICGEPLAPAYLSKRRFGSPSLARKYGVRHGANQWRDDGHRRRRPSHGCLHAIQGGDALMDVELGDQENFDIIMSSPPSNHSRLPHFVPGQYVEHGEDAICEDRTTITGTPNFLPMSRP